MAFSLKDVDVILLDQGETFMFENDRFGPDEDYASTYQRVGGMTQSPDEVQKLIEEVFGRIVQAYDSRIDDDRFPTVGDLTRKIAPTLPPSEVDLIDDIIAEHEIGVISKAHRSTIRMLASTHRLGIISNVFAQPPRFEHNLQKTGIFDCFEHIVWSSTESAIKPSPKVYQVALDYWQMEADRIVYVGNDARRDVGGSKGVGMRSVWINLHGAALPAGLPQPDATLSDLSQLVEL